jgi:hypothetical protein
VQGNGLFGYTDTMKTPCPKTSPGTRDIQNHRVVHMNNTTDFTPATIHLTVDSRLIQQFSPILQQGFMVNAQLGSSIRNILCSQLGFATDYLNNRINTIFLDGRPVDDVDKATVNDGSVLALSGSMPGFVGAALRRGGFYATMRGEITHKNDTESVRKGQGFFVVKLYNLLITEMGPVFLARGIVLEASHVVHFLRNRSPEFWSACARVEFNGRSVDPSEFSASEWLDMHGTIMLKVDTT